MSEWAAFEVGVHLLHDRMPAVGLLRLEHRQRAVREQRVVAVDREQLALVGGVELWDAAHDQPGGDLLGLGLGAERRELNLGDLRVADPALLVFVEGNWSGALKCPAL